MAGDGCRWRQAQWQSSEVTVRVHVIKSRWTTAELLVHEMESLSVLRHPNILLLMATCCGPTKNDLLLVLEPVHTPSLFQMLHRSEDYHFGHRERMGIMSGSIKGECM